MIFEAVLHLQIDRASQRIETERRIIGHHGYRLNRSSRDQIPVHCVAERFVDAHPILVNRKSLRRAGNRRGDKTTELHVWLEWIACDLIYDDAWDILLQRVGDIGGASPVDLFYVNNVDACRNLFDLDASV